MPALEDWEAAEATIGTWCHQYQSTVTESNEWPDPNGRYLSVCGLVFPWDPFFNTPNVPTCPYCLRVL